MESIADPLFYQENRKPPARTTTSILIQKILSRFWSKILDFSVFLIIIHRLVVFPEGFGKLTASVTAGHEIKITSFCGVKSTVKSIPAGTANGRWWEAKAEIRVEWTFGPQIFTGQVSVEFL